MFPTCRLSQEVYEFIDALHEFGWITPFNWGSWTDQAKRYVDDPEALSTADVETLQKLLTTHVRQDRFCDGHLLSMFTSGHMTAILRRIGEIAREDRGTAP